MEKAKKNVPEIRFPGFTDPWEQRKLIDYLEVSKVKNKDEAFGKEDVLSVSGDYGVVNQIEFQGRSFAGVSVAPYGVVDTGDVIYTKSPLKSNPYGIIKTNKGKPGIVSTLYAVYKPLKNVHSEFVQIYFEQDARMNNYMHPLVNKGAKNDMKVSDENALKGEVCFPSKEEQIKISDYFAKLDNLITLHQRKCDELKRYKKGLLQQMFPHPGELFPRVRFPGFTDPWEQRKFDEITVPAGVRNKDNLPLEPYSITNDRGFLPQNEAHDDFGYMQNTDRKAYMVVSPNSFGYNPARINVGSIGYYEGPENVIVSSLYEIFKTKDYIDDHFLMQWFKSDLFPRWIEKFQEGSVRQYFYYDKLCECTLTFPSIEEQQKIAALIDSLDATITLHQCKCYHNYTGIYTVRITSYPA